MAGGPPKYKMVAKRKDKTGKPVNLFAMFDGKYGLNAVPEREYGERPGVESITMTDGTVLTLADWWLNVEAPRSRKDDDDDGGDLF